MIVNIMESETESKEDSQYLTVTAETQRQNENIAFNFEDITIEPACPKPGSSPASTHETAVGDRSDQVLIPKTLTLSKDDGQQSIENEDMSADMTEMTRNIQRKFLNRRQTDVLHPIAEAQKITSTTGRNAGLFIA